MSVKKNKILYLSVLLSWVFSNCLWAQEKTRQQIVEGTPPFYILVEQVRVLNRHQIGFFLKVVDSNGVLQKLDSSSIIGCKLGERSFEFWQLEWYAFENPYQKIESVKGLKQYFEEDFVQLKSMDESFFKKHRNTNRIEIKKGTEKVVVQGEGSRRFKGRMNEVVRLVKGMKVFKEMKMASLNRSGRGLTNYPNNESVYRIEGSKYQPNSRSNSLKLKNGLNSSESRIQLREIKSILSGNEHHKRSLSSNKKNLIVFSEMADATSLNASVVVRRSIQNGKVYHYRPRNLNIKTRHMDPVAAKEAQYSESQRFLHSFESATGYNLIILDVNIASIESEGIKFGFQIETDDSKTHHVNARTRLEEADKGLLKYWLKGDVEQDAVKQHITLKQLFDSKQYQELVSQTKTIYSKRYWKRGTPMPFLAKWIFWTAEAYLQMGDRSEAIRFYRKLVREFSFSEDYTSAWGRLSNLGGSKLFSKIEK